MLCSGRGSEQAVSSGMSAMATLHSQLGSWPAAVQEALAGGSDVACDVREYFANPHEYTSSQAFKLIRLGLWPPGSHGLSFPRVVPFTGRYSTPFLWPAELASSVPAQPARQRQQQQHLAAIVVLLGDAQEAAAVAQQQLRSRSRPGCNCGSWRTHARSWRLVGCRMSSGCSWCSWPAPACLAGLGCWTASASWQHCWAAGAEQLRPCLQITHWCTPGRAVCLSGSKHAFMQRLLVHHRRSCCCWPSTRHCQGDEAAPRHCGVQRTGCAIQKRS